MNIPFLFKNCFGAICLYGKNWLLLVVVASVLCCTTASLSGQPEEQCCFLIGFFSNSNSPWKDSIIALLTDGHYIAKTHLRRLCPVSLEGGGAGRGREEHVSS